MRRKLMKHGLMAGAATAMTGLIVGPAQAQDARDGAALEEIVVTAQKREQNLQDVPIAVTALTGQALATNRVASVTDLSGLAPGVTVRSSAGGSAIPSFTIRGAVSYGVVPGTDRQISVYLDGVYLSAPRGATFDLPDLERIEMLRGPQGTLFGRNATAGAVSIATHDPKGELGGVAELTWGNYDQVRAHIGLETPRFGPFSAYVSYVHSYKRGDIRNLAAGTRWDRTTSPDPLAAKVRYSPKWLGTKDVDSFFGALKFESGDFVTTYKFDWTRSQGTPEGVGLIGVSDASSSTANFFRTLVATQANPIPIASDGKRPDAVYNGYTIPIDQKNVGHSVTSTLQLSDNLSLKNVFGYRTAKIFSAQAIDGVSSLIVTSQAAPLLGLPASTVGSPFVGFGTAVLVRNTQLSDELQLNFRSDIVTLTAGALWFKGKDISGTNRVANTVGFAVIPGGVVSTAGNFAETTNRIESFAGYAQAELHLLPQLDVVGGIRVTHDHKTGNFTIRSSGTTFTPSFTYSATKPNYLVGVNFRPVDDMLVYAKYSTAYVSGGTIADISFPAETATSWEGGIKLEALDHKLRTNLAVYTVTYKNLQTSQSAALVPGIPAYLGTIILPQGGPVKARGFEFEATAAPTQGLTLGGSLSYTRTTASDINPLILGASGGVFILTYRPEWTGGLWGQFETQPIRGDAYLSLRVDGNWQSRMPVDSNQTRTATWAPAFASVAPYWLVNARLALRNIKLGTGTTEIAVWAKNLTQTRSATFGLNLNNTLAASSYVPARTFGADLSVRF